MCLDTVYNPQLPLTFLFSPFFSSYLPTILLSYDVYSQPFSPSLILRDHPRVSSESIDPSTPSILQHGRSNEIVG